VGIGKEPALQDLSFFLQQNGIKEVTVSRGNSNILHEAVRCGTRGEEIDAVGETKSFPQTVRHQQGGKAPLCLEFGKTGKDVGLDGFVQALERFVHQDELWVGHQCARDVHPLAHPPTELRRVRFAGFGHIHEAQRFVQGCLVCRGGDETQVLRHVFPWDKAVFLEHEGDARGVDGERAVPMVTMGVKQTGDKAQQGGFSTTGWAHDSYVLTGVNLERHTIEHGKLPEFPTQTLYGYECCHDSTPRTFHFRNRNSKAYSKPRPATSASNV